MALEFFPSLLQLMFQTDISETSTTVAYVYMYLQFVILPVVQVAIKSRHVFLSIVKGIYRVKHKQSDNLSSHFLF